ncbi:MAG: CCA tRNA nucleotidyltransferase [Bacteroidia bacterium]
MQKVQLLDPHLWQHKPFFLAGQVADTLGVQAYVVGGWLRDYLLWGVYDREIDIAVVGDAEAFAKALAQALDISVKATYKRFHAHLLVWEEKKIEVVATRKESYPPTSRHPAVEAPVSLEEDLRRRDFTVNALYLGLHPSERGMLFDGVEGLMDLRSQQLRTPLEPEKTFHDDPLRMLRAIRFVCQLYDPQKGIDFRIEPITWAGIQTQAHRLAIISPERIMEEFHKILMSGRPSLGLRLLQESHLLPYILKELSDLASISYETRGHKENFSHTLQVLENLLSLRPEASVWLRWAALLHDIGKAPTKRYDPVRGWTFDLHEEIGAKMAEGIFRRLKLPMDKLKYVQKLVRLHMRPAALVRQQASDSSIRRLAAEAGEDLEDLITLCRADITTKNLRKKAAYLKNFDQVIKWVQSVQEKDNLRNFQPPIRGEELIRFYGKPPGPWVGALKNALKEAILEGEVPNQHAAAWAYLTSVLAPTILPQYFGQEFNQNSQEEKT